MTQQSKCKFKIKVAEAGFKNDTDFAKALGVTPAVVHKWSTGVRPTSKNLLKITKITNGKMDANWFLDFYEICKKEKKQSKKV